MSTAYLALGAFVLLVVGLLLVSGEFVSWGNLINSGAASRLPSANAIVVVTFAAFSCNIVASLVYRVQQAVQQISRANFWQSLTSAFGLVAILTAATLNLDGALFVAVAVFAAPAASSIYTLIFFTRNLEGRALRPRFRDFGWEDFRFLFGIGSRFLAISILMSVSLGIDTWIIARAGSLADATRFAVPSRVLGLVGSFVVSLAAPLWPMVASALATHDIAWARNSVRRMTLVLFLLSMAASGGIVLVAPFIFRTWLGEGHTPSMMLLLGLAAWNVAQAVVSPTFMVQNAAKVLLPQTIGYVLLLATVPVKWAVVENGYVDWVPWITVIGYLTLIWPSAMIGYRRAMRNEGRPDHKSSVEMTAG